jgi:ribonuclease-3
MKNSKKILREQVIFETIDYKFKDPKLLEQAFTCSSAINERISSLSQSFERLEFLGDSILKTIITEFLFKIFANESEGFLTQMRSRLEQNKTLSITGNKLRLLDLVIEGKFKRNKKLQADLIESIIGAIFVDSSYDYKVTRYHTLLLIRENILEQKIDPELFIEYVQYCREDIQKKKVSEEGKIEVTDVGNDRNNIANKDKVCNNSDHYNSQFEQKSATNKFQNIIRNDNEKVVDKIENKFNTESEMKSIVTNISVKTTQETKSYPKINNSAYNTLKTIRTREETVFDPKKYYYDINGYDHDYEDKNKLENKNPNFEVEYLPDKKHNTQVKIESFKDELILLDDLRNFEFDD